MHRRAFLLGAAGLAGAAAAGGAAFWRWQEIDTATRAPGRELGHLLRDHAAWPAPRAEIDTEVLIAGSGAAGLSAGWQLARRGFKDFVLLAGPEQFGNLASGAAGEAAYPTGAHYLPLPSKESLHVREMLAAFGMLEGAPDAARPVYDERVLVHAPEARVLIDGTWHDGLLPPAAFDEQSAQEIQRFLAHIDTLAAARGTDGKRAFAMPVAMSSADPAWRALDALTFAAWLAREGYKSAALRAYLDYAVRDDYGRGAEEVSAYAGLHYFASRAGEAANAEHGAVLTWPGGLSALAAHLARTIEPARLRPGTLVSLRETAQGVEGDFVLQGDAGLERHTVRARRAICALPLFVAARVVQGFADTGFDAARHLPQYAPWLVSNFVMNRFPAERAGVPLAWDNIVHGSSSLGYVVSTHQDIRVGPPARTVFTAYHALAEMTPAQARRWLDTAAPDELLQLAGGDLRAAYGVNLAACCERAEITLRGHAMAVPQPGYLANPGLAALRAHDGKILYAHSDLSGYSVFEEASWWGVRAAARVLGEA